MSNAFCPNCGKLRAITYPTYVDGRDGKYLSGKCGGCGRSITQSKPSKVEPYTIYRNTGIPEFGAIENALYTPHEP